MEVVHNAAQHRFELHPDGIEGQAGPDADVAFLVYDQRGGRMILVHTEVPARFEGRGLGGMLVRAAVEYARAQQLRVVPLCPFARAYLQRHPEYADRVTGARSADT